MKKLREIIVNAYDYGKIPKGLTPYMIDRLVDIYNALVRKGRAEFIETEINDLLNRCGIMTREHGIGWIAEI